MILALVVKHKGNWSKVYSAIQNKDYPEEDYVEKVANEYKDKYITILDNEYPEYLKQGYQPPFVLFYEGHINLLKDNNYKKIAINDSKKVSTEDTMVAKEILSNVPENIAFVLGGEGVMSEYIAKNYSNPIIMVLAYSPEQYGYVGLKQRIIQNGGVILSEYPDSAFIELSNEHFHNRYRIMATISEKVLLLTSSPKTSGANIMVCIALSQGKDILTVPVSPLNTESANNQYIYEGAIPIYNNLTLCDNLG